MESGGDIMTLFAGVLQLSAWAAHDSECLLVAFGYILVFATIGIRWFKWDVR